MIELSLVVFLVSVLFFDLMTLMLDTALMIEKRQEERERVMTYYDAQVMKNYQYKSILSKMAETKNI